MTNEHLTVAQNSPDSKPAEKVTPGSGEPRPIPAPEKPAAKPAPANN